MRLFIPLLFISFISHSQIRLSVELDGSGTGDVFIMEWGMIVEKKLDLNKSFVTGFSVHNMDIEVQQLSIDTSQIIHAQYLSIPLGYNHYVTPQFYINFTNRLNFFMNGYERLRNNYDDTYLNKIELAPDDKFKSLYLSHQLTINFIIFRRLHFGGGIAFTTNKNLIESGSRQYLNEKIDGYFFVQQNIRLYLFQFKSKKI